MIEQAVESVAAGRLGRPDAVPGVTSIIISELDTCYETRFISAK
jgi:hypothetical protein